ncbi:MAG: dihydrofolate reductase, partial [Gluconacetobacter diazotrophicus]|nr:dihydrofolate reductase [Gluconacetobacter diazotrophicus]
PLPPGIGGPDVRAVADLAAFRPEAYAPRAVWVIGGAEVFAQTLPSCAAVYLSLVDREVADGDTFFPAFEADFPVAETIRREPGFEVVRFSRRRDKA